MDATKCKLMLILLSLARTASSWNTLTAVVMSRRFLINTLRWRTCQLCQPQRDTNQLTEGATSSCSMRHYTWRIWSTFSLIQTIPDISNKKYNTIHTIRKIRWQLQDRKKSSAQAYIQRGLSCFWTLITPLKGTLRYTHTSIWHLAITGTHTKLIPQEQNMACRRRYKDKM